MREHDLVVEMIDCMLSVLHTSPMPLVSHCGWIPPCGSMSMFAVLIYDEASYTNAVNAGRCQNVYVVQNVVDPTIKNFARSKLNTIQR